MNPRRPLGVQCVSVNHRWGGDATDTSAQPCCQASVPSPLNSHHPTPKSGPLRQEARHSYMSDVKGKLLLLFFISLSLNGTKILHTFAPSWAQISDGHVESSEIK